MAATAAAAQLLVFYTNPLAYFPARVALTLAEKGLPHQTVKMDLASGGGLTPEFMRLNPNSTVPVLKHGDKVITESTRIVEYLDTLDGSPLGGTSVDRAFVEQFVKDTDQWDGNLYAFKSLPPKLVGILKRMGDYRVKVATARAAQYPDLKAAYEAKIGTMHKNLDDAKDKAKVDACLAELTKILDTAEAKLSQTQQFLAGPEYTIADAILGPILYRVTAMGQHKELIATRPALQEYMRRVRERPSWKAAFGENDSAWGKVSWFGVPLLKTKFNALLGRY